MKKIIRELVYAGMGLLMYFWFGFEVTTVVILCFISADIDHNNTTRK